MSSLKDISDSEDNNDSNTNVINQDRPPELPPRPLNLLSLSPRPPPPHAPAYQSPTLTSPPSTDQSVGNINHTCRSRPWYGLLFQKYVLLTVICGTLSIILGVLFITIYFIVRNTTTSLHYFETIPTYIPGVAMTITGIMVMLFSKTNHRKSCFVKICGCFCLLSSLLCVVVTVTTTVIHMNRLQTLRECVYQASTKTCTCFAGIMDPRSIDHDATLRYVFAAAPNCEVIHGTIYSCLRAMFGLSVIGILVSIFSCMLVYQILSHEKKKKYLAELNSRCRTLYQRPGLNQSHHSQYTRGRYADNTQLCHYPWELNNRLCTGMSGNLYTPTPENSISTISTTINTTPTENTNSRGQECSDNSFANWRWLPWNRKTIANNNSQLIHSHSDTLGVHQRSNAVARPPHWRYSHSDAIYGFRPPALQNSRETMSSYSVTGQYGRALPGMDLGQIDSLSNLLWGPPPPYSHPPSTADISDPSPSTSLPTTETSESPQRSQSRLSRTTKSGILVESKDIDVGKKTTNSESPIHYDETVDSAMHIYEKLRRSRSGSLPSRRVKKDKKMIHTVSSANLIDESLPTRQLNQNLSALNLSRAEELRTAKDLEEIKRALIALQQNSLGIFKNIQYDNQLYLKGNTVAQGEVLQKIEFSNQKQGQVIQNINQVLNNPGPAHKKSRGLYSISNEHLGQTRSQPKFSLSSVQRKTISTQNLLRSGSDSDNSYGLSSVTSMSVDSRGSSNLSSPGPSNSISPYIMNQVNQVQNNPQGVQNKYPLSPKFSTPLVSNNSQEERQVIKTQELPHINSSIIQTANKKLLCLQNNSHQLYGKLPLSLSGLISPRHNSKDRQQITEHPNNGHYLTEVRESALKYDNGSVHPSVSKPLTKPVTMSDQSDRLLSGLISPTRMYPSNFSPLTNQNAPPAERRKSGFVYLRPEQNIPESFCDKFRPIAPAGDVNLKYSENKNEFIDVKNVSSDDIVVTLHSVNV